jgi:hypothetical protein
MDSWLTGVKLIPPPGQASNPNPPDEATDVNVIADLSWSAGLGATSYDVYFGTSSPGTFQGNQTHTIFDPGIMAGYTTYYWRIDSVNDKGIKTIGTVWSFTTIDLRASNPNPPDGATDVSVTADLSWSAGPGATSYDVHFGTDSPGTLQCNQTDTIFDPGTMAGYTTYYWRIDSVNSQWGTAVGTVWSFTTLDLRASNPNPPDGATGVSITTDLSWTAGPGAISHDVYFGTSNPPPFLDNQSLTTFDPGTLAYNTSYYWRIDELNSSGTTTGTVWSFITVISPPPP